MTRIGDLHVGLSCLQLVESFTFFLSYVSLPLLNKLGPDSGLKNLRPAMQIDQFRYIKIQPKTIDLSTRLWRNNYRVCGVYSPEPRTEVYCLRLNFNISKLVYLPTFLRSVLCYNAKTKTGKITSTMHWPKGELT